jgi:folylpolyglutamate synthase/dihydropteroate synthase
MWRTIQRGPGRCAPGCGLEGKRPRTLIFSCLRDKPVAEMAQILFPLFEQVILAPIHSARAAAMEELEATARATGSVTVRADSVREAVQWAGERGAGGVVVVSGSVYLVGEARSLLLGGELGSVERMRQRPNPMPRIYRWRTNI